MQGSPAAKNNVNHYLYDHSRGFIRHIEYMLDCCPNILKGLVVMSQQQNISCYVLRYVFIFHGLDN